MTTIPVDPSAGTGAAVQLLRNSPQFRQWRSSDSFELASLTRTDIARSPVSAVVAEKHFTPQELAEAWGVSVQTIRDVFRNEEGVLKLGSNGTRTKRRYKTLRIPESVAKRVHTRLSA